MRALKILCLACALAFAVAGMTACGGKAKNIETAEVSLSQTEYVYDGTEKKPAATVKLGETTLSADDYSLTYENNVNAGTAKVTVTGKGGYTGAVSAEFTIKKAQSSPEEITVTAKYGQKIADVVNEQGFTLDASNAVPADTVLSAAGEKAYTIKIVYVPEDTANYENGVQTVHITVEADYTEDENDNVADDDDFTVPDAGN